MATAYDPRGPGGGGLERERIAQDLHDGVQQRLTALRIGLSLAAERLGERTEAGAMLQGFGDDVDRVVEEVRDLAHGIYPALLTPTGWPRRWLLSVCNQVGK